MVGALTAGLSAACLSWMAIKSPTMAPRVLGVDLRYPVALLGLWLCFSPFGWLAAVGVGLVAGAASSAATTAQIGSGFSAAVADHMRERLEPRDLDAFLGVVRDDLERGVYATAEEAERARAAAEALRAMLRGVRVRAMLRGVREEIHGEAVLGVGLVAGAASSVHTTSAQIGSGVSGPAEGRALERWARLGLEEWTAQDLEGLLRAVREDVHGVYASPEECARAETAAAALGRFLLGYGVGWWAHPDLEEWTPQDFEALLRAVREDAHGVYTTPEECERAQAAAEALGVWLLSPGRRGPLSDFTSK